MKGACVGAGIALKARSFDSSCSMKRLFVLIFAPFLLD